MKLSDLFGSFIFYSYLCGVNTTIKQKVLLLEVGYKSHMMLCFKYNASEFSLWHKRFAGSFISEIRCTFDDETYIKYEHAWFEFNPIFERYSTSTILVTLSDAMIKWNDYQKVNSKKELIALIDVLLIEYGENVKKYFGRDDWDDYIAMLLECKDVLSAREISDDEFTTWGYTLLAYYD